MTSIKSLLFRRSDKNGIDVYFAPRKAGIKSLLFQLVPTRYRAQKYNRQLRREIEENPDGALIVWERENSSQLYYVFHGMAGGLGIQPLTVLRETGLIHNNLILLKDYYRFFYQAGLNREITDVDAIIARLRRCREELPHVRQTFCCGPSSGGYAAILFGHYLQVDVVYAFAPVTLINLDDLKKLRRPQGRLAHHRAAPRSGASAGEAQWPNPLQDILLRRAWQRPHLRRTSPGLTWRRALPTAGYYAQRHPGYARERSTARDL